MYIWVILAVFMVTLASFHVPVRNDMADFTEVPRADAVVTSLIEQQKAAVKFIRAICQSDENVLEAREGTFLDENVGMNVNAVIPKGRNDDNNCLSRHNPRYNFDANSATSEIYCLDGSGAQIPCGAGSSSYMLITFAPIPEDWKTPEGRPDIHLRAALGRHGGEANLGWSQLGDGGATGGNFTSLVRYGRENSEIPNGITEDMNRFTSTCETNNGGGSNPHCLVIWNKITSCAPPPAAADPDSCGLLPENTPSECNPNNPSGCNNPENCEGNGIWWIGVGDGVCWTKAQCIADKDCAPTAGR